MSDVAVVGSGPNGLAAAVTMARAGLSVHVYEAAETVGGGTRTTELMELGHVHDICSAVHPLALASPFFRAFGLSKRIELITPDIAYGHPLDGGRSALAYRDLGRTVEALGRDGDTWRRVFAPLVRHVDGVVDVLLNSLLRVPADPVALTLFGLRALQLGTAAGRAVAGFRTEEARSLFSGVASHPVGPQPSLSSAGAGLLLGTAAHAKGWPIPIGGSQAIANAMVADLLAHGGTVTTGRRVTDLNELKSAKTVLLDVAPRGFLEMSRDLLPLKYANALRQFRYADAACKVDFILSGPVPWADPELTGASTVHVGGSSVDIARAENDVAAGRHPDRPFVLASQPTPFDSSRAPAGHHVLWTYCHVPAGSTRNMTEAIADQIERFAPGFRDVVVRSQATTAAGLERYNANYVGGDFGSGATSLRQMVARPTFSPKPWVTPLEGVYLCSSSTPPGPGVHGMSGYLAAKIALKRQYGLQPPPLNQ